ncbi:glycosyltransferase family 2 protein [Phyllobacterium lublinensis]|uniref:glycosyltransferase family 2 protein n=1 Tax=Phyllobacterium lublinensis TaxID=2875708 RepID=UPI001CCBC6FB|nr:glycosyltransferase family 2 protein [Phyllobacterium sp. 2063]
MDGILLLLWHSDWVLLAFSVLIFELPRYTFSLVSLAVLIIGRRRPHAAKPDLRISVAIPAFNGAGGLRQTIASLCNQSVPPYEIIVINDGSLDQTPAIAEQALAEGLVDLVIHNPSRCGRSPGINLAARFARGDLILTVDPDTVFSRTALERMSAAFSDPHLAAASCNIGVRNESATIWTELQALEYLMSISAGKSFLAQIGAISCCSGACSLYRRDIFSYRGGLDVGPGEDLEITLRLRRFGYRVGFVPDAWASTMVPESFIALARQRLRWDRDAFRVRLIQYRECWPFRSEGLSDTLQRLDFIVFDVVPTLSLPFYLAYCVLIFGPDTLKFLAGVSLLLMIVSLFNLALTGLLFNQRPRLFSVLIAPIFPVYQGILMKGVRFWAFTSELLFSASRHDDYVPPRVRRVLANPTENSP